jgi:hypothetical protein
MARFVAGDVVILPFPYTNQAASLQIVSLPQVLLVMLSASPYM